MNKTAKIKLFPIIIIVFILLSYFMCINTYAACPICKQEHGKPRGTIPRFLYKAACDVYSTSMLFGSESGTSTVDVMAFDVGSTNFSNLWSAAENVYNSIARIGELLCVVYGYLRIMEQMTDDTLTPEKFVLTHIRMIIGILICRNGFEIATIAMNFGTTIFNLLHQQETGAFSGACPYLSLKDGSMEGIMQNVTIVIPYFAVTIAKVILSVICWFRILDLMVRVVFVPIGMADLIYDGTESHGFNYLRKLMASALEGAVILALVQSYSTIVSMVASISGGWYTLLIVSFALITTLTKAQTYANDTMGV